MNILRTPTLLCLVPALLVGAASCRADSVDLAVNGNLYGAYALAPNTTVSEQFTLAQATDVTAFQVGVASVDPIGGILDGSFQVELTGPGGATYALDEGSANGMMISGGWLSTPVGDILPEGTYTLTFIGGSCGSPDCDEVAAIDYYLPASYTQIGGTLSNGADFGFDLIGSGAPTDVLASDEVASAVAPEPATLALLSTGLLVFFFRRYRLSQR